MPYRILLVEDHMVLREALKSVIDDEDDLEVVGEAEDGREGLEKAIELIPDVVIMDLTMPGLNGIEATVKIREKRPDIKILALSMHAKSPFVKEMFKCGAKGFLVKTCSMSEMLQAIRCVAGGRCYISPSVAGCVVDQFVGRSTGEGSMVFNLLSSREREVLQLFAEGFSAKEIAGLLNLSVSTVESHRRQLKRKLKAGSIAEMVKIAIREGLTPLDG